MVIVEGIREVGLCEHHLLPILMSITIAYVPDKKILGLSKLSRIAGYFARRLQNQERTAHSIADIHRTSRRTFGRRCIDRWQTHVRDGAGRAGRAFGDESERHARLVSEGPKSSQRIPVATFARQFRGVTGITTGALCIETKSGKPIFAQVLSITSFRRVSSNFVHGS